MRLRLKMACVGALGTVTHLNLAPVAGAAVPWGLALALLLAGSTQRWWMRVAAASGAHPVPAGGAVAIGAFTAVLALYRLPATDRLGLPWTAQVAQAMPTALLASALVVTTMRSASRVGAPACAGAGCAAGAGRAAS